MSAVINVENLIPRMSSGQVSRHIPNVLSHIEEEEKVPHDNIGRSARYLEEIKRQENDELL